MHDPTMGTYEEYLEHYGVMGMRWGKRKASYSQVRKLGAKNIKKEINARQKATKYRAKANKIAYKTAKYNRKVYKGKDRNLDKEDKLNNKATKLERKATKWEHKEAYRKNRVQKILKDARKKTVDSTAANRYEELFDSRHRGG